MKKGTGWTQILIPIAVIAFGLLTSYIGLMAAFSGDSGSTPSWIPSVGEGLMPAGACVAAGGVVWLIVVLVALLIGLLRK